MKCLFCPTVLPTSPACVLVCEVCLAAFQAIRGDPSVEEDDDMDSGSELDLEVTVDEELPSENPLLDRQNGSPGNGYLVVDLEGGGCLKVVNPPLDVS